MKKVTTENNNRFNVIIIKHISSNTVVTFFKYVSDILPLLY